LILTFQSFRNYKRSLNNCELSYSKSELQGIKSERQI
jgi:hypothetical protein